MRPRLGLFRFPLTTLVLALAGDWAGQAAIGTAYGIRPLILAFVLAALWRGPAAKRISVAVLLVLAGALGELAAGVAIGPVLAGALACVVGIASAEALRRVAWPVVRRGALALLVLAPMLLPLGRWIGRVDGAPPLAFAVLSSVPLGPIADGSGRNVPLMTALRTVGPVTLLDRMPGEGLAADRLMLLQPRRLDPAELVAIDAWVRAGGQALVLADPALRWGGDHPLGDPRNPLPVSLLDPLLEHWGVRLELADPTRRGDDAILTAPGFFTALSSQCEPRRDATVALCRAGRGRALIVADADWLNPADWRPGDRRPARLARALRYLRVPVDDGPIDRWPWLLLIGLAFASWERTRPERTRGEHN